MSTLMQELPEKIARLEAKHGSENPFVKQLKEQLRAMQEVADKPAQEVYRMQAVSFQPSASASDQEQVDEAADGQYRIAKFKHQNEQLRKQGVKKKG